MAGADDNDWEQTLQKMAGLDELSKAASTGAQMLTEKRGNLNKMIHNMMESVKLMKENIATIKSEGNTAKKACKELIKNKYGPLQDQNVKAILENVKTMSDMGELEKNIRDLSSDLGRLKQATGSSGIEEDATDGRRNMAAAAAAAGAAGAAGAKGEEPMEGGYTYGKSRKRGKGRKKRTKKSRRKGKGSKRR
tara:strand:+ start:3117 stop:3695 length:579 start_codon:yes stop_codon:yes gene_type:complete